VFSRRNSVGYFWEGKQYEGVVYECSEDDDVIEIYLTSKGSGIIRCRLTDLLSCGLYSVTDGPQC